MNDRLFFVFNALGAFLWVATAQALDENFVWQTEGCKVVAKSADITLQTNGHLSQQKIHFHISSEIPLKKMPEIQINTMDFASFNLEGIAPTYGFEMDYSPAHVARLLDENSALVVEYEPNASDADGRFYTYHAQFPLHDLPQKIAQLSKKCGAF